MSQQDLINKIRNLRDKAANEASTEAEAIQAAEMAARLMAKHEISEVELQEAKDEGLVSQEAYEDGAKALCPAVNAALYGIFSFTQTDGFIRNSKRKGDSAWRKTAMFVGLPADREMAIYLAVLVQGASARSWKAFYKQHKAQFGYHSPSELAKARNSYKTGFGIAVGERLEELAAQRKEQQAQASTKRQ